MHDRDAPDRDVRAPRLVEGVELIGEYPDSGYVEPPLMARRRDGGLVQLPAMLYAVAERLDGTTSTDEIAADLSARLERGLEGDDVRFLVDEKLAPLGIAEPTDGREVAAPAAADPLLALKLKTSVVPRGVVRAGTTILQPLFFPVVVLAFVGALIAADVWFFAVHGLAQGTRSILQTPSLMLGVLALVVVTAAIHELGHAAGSRYGGAEPGEMGVGIYIVWPAFYTDISASHTLGRWGRLRADLGGVYMNVVLALLTMGAAVATGWEFLFIVVLLQQFEIARQLLPLLRLDGYYVVSDLVGVPDLFGRIGPILRSFVPGTDPDPRVTALKPWVRVVVTAWVVAVVAFLSFYTVMLLLALPRIVATGWDSFRSQWDRAGTAFDAGDVAGGAVAVLQMAILAAPVIGISYMLVKLVGRWRAAWARTADRPGARTMLVAVTVAGLGLLAWAWWPSTDSYRPIGEDERWTVGELAGSVVRLASGPGAAIGRATETTSPDASRTEDPATGPAGGGASPAPSPASSDPGPSPSVSPRPSTSATPSPSAAPSPSPTRAPSPSASATASPTPAPGSAP